MKRGIADLVAFGGPPAFTRARYVGRPNTGDRARFLRRVNRMLDSQWLTNAGPLVREFEARIADLVGVRHCVSTTSATVALQMLVAGDDGGGGEEVILPAMTFPATAHAVRWRGLRPVFCDVDPDTGLLDPADVEQRITPRTSAIIGVHLWGQPCHVEKLEKLAARTGLNLYFDAAHAVGCSSGAMPLGGFGAAEAFSFHATKVVNTFEGGAIVTDDDDVADRVRAIRNFGYGANGVVEMAGTNAKLSEASAAMGLTSLEALGDTVAHNRVNHERYRRRLAGVPGLRSVVYNDLDTNNYHYVIVRVAADVAGIHRDLVLDLLRAENIVAQPYFSRGVHQMKPYHDPAAPRLPHTESLCEQLLALPTGPTVSRHDVDIICDVVRLILTNGPEITARRAAL
jgi:dTDP-4-amino-4,6-dideoxyglucose